MAIKDSIKRIANTIAGEIVELRRHLHSNPELSFQEFETAKFVSEYLKKIGLNPVILHEKPNQGHIGVSISRKVRPCVNDSGDG